MSPPTQIAKLAAATAPNASKVSPRRRWLSRRKLLSVIGLLVLLLSYIFLFHRSGPRSELDSARPIAVVKARRENLKQTLTISAEFRPYREVSLHAKVAGYVQWISVDIGDPVKEGQVLAKLDIPELKNDLQKDTAALQASREEVNRAQANYDQTHLASSRLETVAREHPKLVAQQEVDDAKAKDQSAAGALAAAKQHVDEATAELNKTQALLNYGDITAPFDGVITHRYADPGALIQAGTSSSQTLPVVDIEEESRLRLIFPVPESAVSKIKVGAPVTISVGALNETFTSTVSRFADKLDRDTRTMSTEADVENPDGHFKPGMYADVTVIIAERKNVVTVPVEAVSVDEHKATALTVDGKNIVRARAVTLGMQTAERFEVKSGLSPGDMVIVGSRAGIQPGTKVDPKVTTPTAAPE